MYGVLRTPARSGLLKWVEVGIWRGSCVSVLEAAQTGGDFNQENSLHVAPFSTVNARSILTGKDTDHQFFVASF